MKDFLRGTTILFVVLTYTAQAFAQADYEYFPVLLKVLIEGSENISAEQFEGIKPAVEGLTERLVLRTAYHRLQSPSWVSLSIFGSAEQYSDMRFISCLEPQDVALFYQALELTHHPEYRSTAVYNAVENATFELLEQAETLPGYQVKVLVLFTSGVDTASLAKARDLVRKVYPGETDIYLSIVTFDADTELEEGLQNLADHVGHVEWRHSVTYEDYY